MARISLKLRLWKKPKTIKISSSTLSKAVSKTIFRRWKTDDMRPGYEWGVFRDL
jgi:hypothetical protein